MRADPWRTNPEAKGTLVMRKTLIPFEIESDSESAVPFNVRFEIVIVSFDAPRILMNKSLYGPRFDGE